MHKSEYLNVKQTGHYVQRYDFITFSSKTSEILRRKSINRYVTHKTHLLSENPRND